MMKREIELDDHVTAAELANVVASVFPETFHVYYEFPRCYEDFRREVGSLIHELHFTQNPYEQTDENHVSVKQSLILRKMAMGWESWSSK